MNVLRSRTALYEAAGRWWRFSKYEIRDGMIRPAAGAKLTQYDPWASYAKAKEARSRTEPPYLGIIRLAAQIDEGQKERARRDPVGAREGQPLFTDADRAAIATWCSQWGLLGLLPHFARRAVLAPHWEGWSLIKDVVTGTTNLVPDPARITPTQVTCVRAGATWTVTRSFQVGGSPATPKGVREGDLLLEHGGAEQWPKPSAEIAPSPVYGDSPTEERVGPLGMRWSSYFPDVPRDQEETYNYPPPLSAGFWQVYAESMFEFIEHALLLRQIWENVPHGGHSAPAGARAHGRAALHALVAEVGHVLEEDEHAGGFRRLRVAPSLLGTLALMMFEDLAEPRRVRRCARCQVSFRAGAWANRYCSPRCRKAATQAQFRATQRRVIAKRLGAAGLKRAAASRLAARLERKYQSAKRLGAAATVDAPGFQRVCRVTLPGLSAHAIQRIVRAVR
jgi:hypothetical protein